MTQQPYYMARLGSKTAASLLEYSENKHLKRELRQFDEYIWVDLAHCVMLSEAGIIETSHAAVIGDGLIEIRGSGFRNAVIDAGAGSLLLQVEAELGRKIGTETAGMLHTARSRLDQGPTARRMFKRRRVLDVMESILACSERLSDVADAHRETLMPGFTCLQHAHPTTFGHYLTSVQDRLLEQCEKLAQGYARLNRSPLGAVGLSGTTWPIDRNRTAELLGFSTYIPHARVARDAYYTAEIVAVLSLVMSILSDLSTDLALWSSGEFNLVELHSSFCSTSSIFPNKKNPTSLDAIRAEAGQATQWFSGLLAKFRGYGTSDVVLQEAEIIDEAFDLVSASLDLSAEIVTSLEVNVPAMRSSAASGWTTASCLADHLFKVHSVPYRKGYSLVALLVRHAAEQSKTKTEIEADQVNALASNLGISARLTQPELDAALDAGAFVNAAMSAGGCSPLEVSRLLETYRGVVREQRAFIGERRGEIEAAWATTLLAVKNLKA
ncbi:argininosuccinate lyase [Devosia albogilva]|uniref:Argininosuccinate lyase n=1 Tax=Devosia albogilva TaxID=429726 RepID=A0ABW5QLQ3_9HYPH